MSGRRTSESFWPERSSTSSQETLRLSGRRTFNPSEPDVEESDTSEIDVDRLRADVEMIAAVMKRPIGVLKRPIGILKRPTGAPTIAQPLVQRIINPPIIVRPIPIDMQPIVRVCPPPRRRPSASAASASTVRPSTLKGCLIKMTYTKTNAIGIRVRGGRQLMQVVMKGAPTVLIHEWADACINQLENGQSIDAVKDWLTMQKSLVI